MSPWGDAAATGCPWEGRLCWPGAGLAAVQEGQVRQAARAGGEGGPHHPGWVANAAPGTETELRQESSPGIPWVNNRSTTGSSTPTPSLHQSEVPGSGLHQPPGGDGCPEASVLGQTRALSPFSWLTFGPSTPSSYRVTTDQFMNTHFAVLAKGASFEEILSVVTSTDDLEYPIVESTGYHAAQCPESGPRVLLALPLVLSVPQPHGHLCLSFPPPPLSLSPGAGPCCPGQRETSLLPSLAGMEHLERFPLIDMAGISPCY